MKEVHEESNSYQAEQGGYSIDLGQFLGQTWGHLLGWFFGPIELGMELQC